MSLFDYDTAIQDNCFDEDGNIVNEELKGIFEQERGEAVERVAMAYKPEDAMLAGIKEEVAKLQKRAKVHQNKRDGLKQYLGDYLDGRKFETAQVAISYRKSETVEIADDAAVPEEFRIPQPDKIDKVGVKKALKGGAVIDGAQLVTHRNIQIK